MLIKTVQFADEVIELKETILKEYGGEMLENMDSQTFTLIKGLLKLIDASSGVIREQAEMMESMDRKLDTLIYRKEVGESD